MMSTELFEKEAREYCRLMMLDPDQLLAFAESHTPRWMLVADELIDLAARLTALGVKPNG